MPTVTNDQDGPIASRDLCRVDNIFWTESDDFNGFVLPPYVSLSHIEQHLYTIFENYKLGTHQG